MTADERREARYREELGRLSEDDVELRDCISAEHLKRQIEWSRETFGPGKRTYGVIRHILKELKEIEDVPDDADEWIDVVILALDGAWRNSGKSAGEIIDAYHRKMDKNYRRKWPDWRDLPEDQAIEHDRTFIPPFPEPEFSREKPVISEGIPTVGGKQVKVPFVCGSHGVSRCPLCLARGL